MFKLKATILLIPVLFACSSLANASAIKGLDSPNPTEGGTVVYEESCKVYGRNNSANKYCRDSQLLVEAALPATPPPAI